MQIEIDYDFIMDILKDAIKRKAEEVLEYYDSSIIREIVEKAIQRLDLRYLREQIVSIILAEFCKNYCKKEEKQ